MDTKDKKTTNEKPVSLAPLDFKEALAAFPKSQAKTESRKSKREERGQAQRLVRIKRECGEVSMATININDEMRQAAEYAIKMAKERFGQDLECSEGSLPKLEILIEQAYQQFSKGKLEGMAANETVVNNTAIVWGSYLGEIMRGKWGGSWIVGTNSNRLLLINDINFSPIYYVYQRITGQLQDDVKKYFDEITPKLSAPQKSSLPSIHATNQYQFQEPKVDTNTITINKKLIRTIGIIGGIIIAGIVCVIAFSFIKNQLVGSGEFKSNLNGFLSEADKLNIMTSQGVTNNDYRNQLAQVKSKYIILGNTWSPSVEGDKALFDKAITMWDLTLKVWDAEINGPLYLNPSVVEFPDVQNICGIYDSTKYFNVEGCITALMGSASNFYEQGRSDATNKLK